MINKVARMTNAAGSFKPACQDGLLGSVSWVPPLYEGFNVGAYDSWCEYSFYGEPLVFCAPAVVSAAALKLAFRLPSTAVIVDHRTIVEAEALSTWLPGKIRMTASDVETINARYGI
jgi:hypothetical protein